jgi:hypothetical protein
MTECTQSSFEFAAHFGKPVVADFSGPVTTSDGGALLLRQTDARINLLRRFAACFQDRRDARFVRHEVAEMIAQRVFGIALGYEDVNDHDRLRKDSMLALAAGKRRSEVPLAGKSTLNRLELGGCEATRYKKITWDTGAMDELMTGVFVESYSEPPRQIVLDLDATDLPLHGHQEQRFFHGYYDHYCYLPLYIFCGEHLLCARLRPSNQDAAAGSVDEVAAIVNRIRRSWPDVRIILRGDSGFCRESLMKWCEDNRAGYVFGFARNVKLERLLEPSMDRARAQGAATGEPARVFADFVYETTSGRWSKPRRVVGKAEITGGKENPRFVVTSLAAGEWDAQALYEDFYCQRGEMENRIKEQMSLFADRVSAETMRANQLRVYLAGMAYVLVSALRRIGLQGTEMARAQATTIRLRLLKIGAQVRTSARRVWVQLAASFPLQSLFWRVAGQLRR